MTNQPPDLSWRPQPGVEEGAGILNVTLSQQQLTSLCEPLLQRIMTPVREVAIMASVLLPGDVGIGATGAAAITNMQQPGAGVDAGSTRGATELDAEALGSLSSAALSKMKRQQQQARKVRASVCLGIVWV